MMQTIFTLALYGVAVAGALFVADAVVGFLRASRGIDDERTNRRLGTNEGEDNGSSEQVGVVRGGGGRSNWIRRIPGSRALFRLVQQSGRNVTAEQIAFWSIGIFLVLLVLSLALMPLRFFPLAFVAAIPLSAGPPLAMLMMSRSARRQAFEEQFPDAIDLIVRSLRVGHPLSSALQVIARELPAPIGTEFAIACDEVTYGQGISVALANLTERVGATDLAFLSMAVQIQQDSGGNLAESLSKLSSVVRDRFRMFRKVKAITAEGRFSAWMLSAFPLGIAGVITLIRPDYYSQVSDYPYFPHLVVAALAMLVVNVIAMRFLTALKV